MFHHPHPHPTRLVLPLLALLALPLAALADNLTWAVVGGGAWDDVLANWTGDDTVFENGDSVTFPQLGVNAVITIAANVEPAAVAVSNSNSIYTFNGGPIDGATTTLTKTGGGLLTLNAANNYGGGTLVNGGGNTNNILQVNHIGALGSGALSIQNGSVRFEVGAATFSNPILITGSGAGITTANAPLTLTGGINFAAGTTVVMNRINSGQHLIFLPVPATGSGNIDLHRGGLAISNPNQLPTGNWSGSAEGLYVLDNLSWAEFTAARPNGYGGGSLRWQSLNFAARGTPLLIDESTTFGYNPITGQDAGGAHTTAYFNRTLHLGTTLAVGGLRYADQTVEVAVDTIYTGRHSINPAGTGPGLTGGHSTGLVYTFSGNITDQVAAGVGGSRGNLSVGGSGNGELVLSGMNDWTGSEHSVDTPSNAGNRGMNTGPGGLRLIRNNDNYVRFDGGHSLPTGNGGQPAYILGVGAGSISGVLVTGKLGGENYELAPGMKIVLGTGVTPVFGSSGEPGTAATFEGSAFAIHMADDGVAKSATVLVRGGELYLGSAGKPFLLQPSYGVEPDNTDDLINAAATPIFTSSGARTLVKRGEGTLALANLAYTQVDGSGDTAGQFAWQIGRASNNQGAGAYFDGAVRGLADNDPLADNSNSLKNFAIALRGGVYEVDGGGAASSFTRDLGGAAGQVNWSTGGGGFAAYDGDLAVDLGGAGASFTWASTGSFVTNSQSLIFGSTTATHRVDFQNGINLNGAVREIRVLDNPAAAGDYARISGVLSGTGNSALSKTGDGRLELTNVNTYVGATTVSAGILAVAGSLDARTSLVSVAAGATLTGDGTVLRPISIDAGATLAGNLTIAPQGTTSATIAGTLAPGNSIGTLTFDLTDTSGGLLLAPGATLEIELGPGGSSDLIRIVGYQLGDLDLNDNVVNLASLGGLTRNTAYPLFAFFADDGLTPVAHGLEAGLILGLVPDDVPGFQLDFTSDPSLIQIFAIPEPSTAMLLLGLAALAGRRRRK